MSKPKLKEEMVFGADVNLQSLESPRVPSTLLPGLNTLEYKAEVFTCECPMCFRVLQVDILNYTACNCPLDWKLVNAVGTALLVREVSDDRKI